ncbi:MAG: arginase family protein [Thaumarchaeota archaeon]|nr:arginase family protein [Nitrososphaerota archaeon]
MTPVSLYPRFRKPGLLSPAPPFKVSFTGIPVYTLSRFRGLGLSPARLRKVGATEVVRRNSKSFADAGDLHFPQIVVDTGNPSFRNRRKYVAATKKIAKALASADPDMLVVNIGGECSLIPGVLSGLGRRFNGKPGLVWLDAHGDFNTSQTTPSGYIGGMCLALACGRESSFLRQIGSEKALVSEEAVAHIGSRALDPAEGRAMMDSPMMLKKASALKRRGMESVAAEVARFASERADWVVMHLDLDFLDSALMPAVNFPTPAGMEVSDVGAIANALKESGKLRVLNVTAYDPTKDPTGRYGRMIVKILAEIVSARW